MNLSHQISSPSMSRRYSHIFLDLFGTLIYPTLPVHLHYNRIATLNGFDDFGVTEGNFKSAFKKINQRFPNYGKLKQDVPSAMTPKHWWLQVIAETFKNSTHFQEKKSTFKLEEIEALSKLIYHKFSNNEDGELYSNYPDTMGFVDFLTRSKISFSLITNSDPGILHALPSSLRTLVLTKDQVPEDQSNQIQVFTSWEIGFPKPDRRIWDFAMTNLDLNPRSDRILHIGDDFEEDFLGAKSVGIDSTWLDRKHNERKISKPIATNIQHYPFGLNERISSLTELIGCL